MVKRNTNRGFVLIEVLVAVAVAGLILVALLKAFVNTWYGISTVREEAEAMMIARTLVSAVTPRENAAEASQQGSIGRYNWRLEVKKAPLPAPVTPSPDAETESRIGKHLYLDALSRRCRRHSPQWAENHS